MLRRHPLPYFVALALAGCSADPTETTAEVQSQLTAAPDLIAIGQLSGSGADLATAASAPLESGIVGNMLGGIGSGLAWAGGNNFLALPDRGPNALTYAPAVDNTTSYIPRFHRLKLRLKANRSSASLPYSLTPLLKETHLLSSSTPLVYGSGAGLGVGDATPVLNTKRKHYFVGRSDSFDPNQLSTYPNDGRLDPESLRLANDGESIFVSDEYGPYVYEFARGSGKRLRAFSLPSRFAASHLAPVGDDEISGNTTGRVANKGMEGLAITPDGETLVGIMQSPLLQDGGTSGRFTRIVAIDIASGATREYAYELTNIGSATKPKYPTVSDIVAVNDHQFLVDERDGKGLGDNSSAAFKKIFLIDITAAQEVSELSGEANLAGKAVSKSQLLDVVSVLNAHGIASSEIPAKLEGLAFGEDVLLAGVPYHTLFLANDNDFLASIVDSLHPNGVDNPNQIFVFAIAHETLPGFEPQAFGSDNGCKDD